MYIQAGAVPEAPARVRELEAWGTVFDRTNDGKILQRNFGGNRYPRLADVGVAPAWS
jgi:succinate dehydrogenase / fumarate reductase flavoprotein subunit